ncbi:MAG: hypothetical protein K6F53_05655 [Lachnospiraceae bacterium]|nr:hypothetical protein [Lachnospiraceae bacterium]
MSLAAYDAGVVTLTLGAVFKGVLEIYGTTSHLSVVFPCAGGALLIFSAVLIAVGRKRGFKAVKKKAA